MKTAGKLLNDAAVLSRVNGICLYIVNLNIFLNFDTFVVRFFFPPTKSPNGKTNMFNWIEDASYSSV